MDVWADISVDCSSIFRLVCQLILARLSTKMSVKSWLSIGQVFNQYLSRVVFSCRSRNDQQSVEIALVVCRQCIGQSLVKYW